MSRRKFECTANYPTDGVAPETNGTAENEVATRVRGAPDLYLHPAPAVTVPAVASSVLFSISSSSSSSSSSTSPSKR